MSRKKEQKKVFSKYAEVEEKKKQEKRGVEIKTTALALSSFLFLFLVALLFQYDLKP